MMADGWSPRSHAPAGERWLIILVLALLRGNVLCNMKNLETLHWIGGVDGRLRLIDQTKLPVEFVEIDCRDVQAVWEAIKTLRVRGAPALGIAAAYGVCLGVQSVVGSDQSTFFRRLHESANHLATSRPTAVNLFWALER